jgi:hypothetical protein
MSELGRFLVAADSQSTAYVVGSTVGAAVALSVLFVRVFQSPRVRPRTVLLAVGGMLILLTVAGEIMLATGLTR